MKFRKRGKLFVILLFLVLFIIQYVSSLGVSPPKKEYNFEPGLEQTINFYVFEDNPNRALEIYVLGNLSEYITVDKNEMIGGGQFIVTLKLPNSIDIPGRHRILIGVRQKIDDELVQGNIGTAIAIQVPIYINVPYPGRYLSLDLTGNDVNVGDPITFKLDIKSYGTEDLTVAPKIEIRAQQGEVKDTLFFQERVIRSQEVLNLKKILDTTNLNPGNYKAVAIVDYGVITTDEFDFRIGNLFIDIINYSSVFTIGKLEQFNVEVESGWNNNIDGVYADISIFNSSGVIESFKTTTASLTPWEKKIISGYFDTNKFLEGVYETNISLTYFGKDQGKTTSKSIKVVFYKKASLTIWYVLGGSGLVLIILLLIIKVFFLKKNKNAQHKKKK